MTMPTSSPGFEHGKTSDGAPAEQVGRLTDGHVRSRRDGVTRHHVFHPFAQLEPEIPIGDDTHQLPAMHHDEVADPRGAHPPTCRDDRVLRRDRLDPSRHDILNSHADLLLARFENELHPFMAGRYTG